MLSAFITELDVRDIQQLNSQDVRDIQCEQHTWWTYNRNYYVSTRGRRLTNYPVANRLNEKNYFKWSQIVHTLLKGRGKQSHILGNGLKAGDPKFVAWDEEDSLIMVWLWNSMIPEISDTCLTLSAAQKMWETVE